MLQQSEYRTLCFPADLSAEHADHEHLVVLDANCLVIIAS